MTRQYRADAALSNAHNAKRIEKAVQAKSHAKGQHLARRDF